MKSYSIITRNLVQMQMMLIEYNNISTTGFLAYNYNIFYSIVL